MTPPEGKLERELLLDLYRIAVEEYRFEVHLGWERTSHLLTLDAGLFAASVGLLQLTGGGTRPTQAMVAVVSVIGLGVSWLGVSTVKDSRRYDERAITSYTGWLFALLALVHAALAIVVLA